MSRLRSKACVAVKPLLLCQHNVAGCRFNYLTTAVLAQVVSGAIAELGRHVQCYGIGHVMMALSGADQAQDCHQQSACSGQHATHGTKTSLSDVQNLHDCKVGFCALALFRSLD